MSELTAAMQAALQSVDNGQRTRRPTGESAPTRSTGPGGVALRDDERGLPPVARRREGPTTFGHAVRDAFGPLAAAAWVGVRELFLLVVTFWVAAILVTFAVAEAATLGAVLVATAGLRLLLLGATRAGRLAEAAA